MNSGSCRIFPSTFSLTAAIFVGTKNKITKTISHIHLYKELGEEQVGVLFCFGGYLFTGISTLVEY